MHRSSYGRYGMPSQNQEAGRIGADNPQCNIITSGIADRCQRYLRFPLFGGDVTRGLGQGFDTLLDVSQRLEAGFDGGSRNVSQYVNRNGVAQTIKIIGQLPPTCGEKQGVGPARPGV